MCQTKCSPTKATEGVVSLLSHIGEDPAREGLLKTPARVAKALKEMTSGYGDDPAQILATTFSMDDVDDDVFYGGMVLLKDIEFYSLCEHHMLPFVGTASVGYIPGASGRVVGISKLARLVDCYARRLQCQERLTSQVADALEKHLECSGAIVVIKAEHFCMKMRGVGKQASEMVTSEVRGILKDNAAARAEALRLI